MTISCMCSLSSDWHVCTWALTTDAHLHISTQTLTADTVASKQWVTEACTLVLCALGEVVWRLCSCVSAVQLNTACCIMLAGTVCSTRCLPNEKTLFCTHCLGQKFIFNPSQKKQHVLCCLCSQTEVESAAAVFPELWFDLFYRIIDFHTLYNFYAWCSMIVGVNNTDTECANTVYQN